MSLPCIDEMFPAYLATVPPKRRLELLNMGQEERLTVVHQSSESCKQEEILPRHPNFKNSNPNRKILYSKDRVHPKKQTTPKKHICPECSKSFNRPSSLQIHTNTHTGAYPFRCPYPGCGKRFNVNSNLRRHYRQHRTELLPSRAYAAATPNRSRYHLSHVPISKMRS